jgi:hypothetical protein
METTMTNIIKDKDDLAEVIVAMPFGRLMQVAHELVSMVADADPAREIDTPLGMAEMLNDWAESQQEAD